MKRIFSPSTLQEIPDGTLLSPFMNSKDSMSDLPFDLIDGYSIAFGQINAKSQSKIHIHPHVDQVTYVLSGKVDLKMKGVKDLEPYLLSVTQGQGAISEAGEFFQLINPYEKDCTVLYIVSPAYLFEMGNEKPIYDDSIILNYSWANLRENGWIVGEMLSPVHSLEARKASYDRLKAKKAK